MVSLLYAKISQPLPQVDLKSALLVLFQGKDDLLFREISRAVARRAYGYGCPWGKTFSSELNSLFSKRNFNPIFSLSLERFSGGRPF
jgi:hypothetical protein